jgi:fluoride ion exporter CrcB/FEX
MNRLPAALFVAFTVAFTTFSTWADVVSPLDQAGRSVGRTAAWMIPVALVFIIVAVARRKRRNTP